MSDNFNAEEFEKIDHVQADQDTNITSTSFGAEPDGDMAEEDQFGMDNGTNDDAMFTTGSYTSYSDNQGHVSSGGQPLISFAEDEGNVVAEEPETEPLKPASQKKPSAPTECGQAECPKYTGGVMGIPGMKYLSCWMKNVDPRDMSSMSDQPEPLTLQKPIEGSESGVLQLIYWRDVKRTGLVFGSMVCVLLSLMCCTILSVLAYLSLAVLTVTLSFRVYKNVMQAVQKTNDGHPFKSLLEMDLEVKEEMVESAASKIADNVNSLSRELRRLFLVEDYVDSIKFALLMWLMTYVGSWFNGMTLVILAVVAIFTIPKVYETYQGPIDQNVNLVRNQLNNIMAQVSSKIPFPKAKAKTQ
ncbi:reticulon-1-A-like isoform X5 [Dreissena polymorpha]|uniref:reticulon-1-A-like isoform X5 n=1 Tax=Dreissena polymorpha TaxID=45954 RepID=UPI002264C99A|nr:reticulon-1-A-like isoform X5 [Dreissena polymorpha]